MMPIVGLTPPRENLAKPAKQGKTPMPLALLRDACRDWPMRRNFMGVA
jgi:hypothetical protein